MLIQYILVALIVGALYGTWRRASTGALSRLAAALWSALWIGAIIVVLRPGVADMFAAAFGVGRGADVIVYFSIVFLFYLVFRVFLRLSKIERDLTAVVREMGLRGVIKDRDRT